SRRASRTLSTFVIDLLLLAGAGVLLAIGLAGSTLRGDLAANVGAAIGLLAAAALVHARVRRIRERLGGPLGLARALAAHTEPLRERPTAREREADVILRHELLGATELWMQLEAHASASPELAAAYVRRIG